MAKGLGNPYRLMGAVSKREREAVRRLPQPCVLHPDRDGLALIESWDGSLRAACNACSAYGERNGWRVIWDEEPESHDA